MKFLYLLFLPVYFIIAQEDDKNSGREQPFSLSLSSRYSTSQINRGVNVSGTHGTISNGIILGHSNGLSFSFSNTRFSTGGTLSNSFGAGYSIEFTDFLYTDFDFTYSSYPDKTINPNAEFPAMLSLAINADLQLFDLSVSADKYFGNGAPLYFNLGVSKIITFERLLVMPVLDVAFIFQEINYSTAKFIPKTKIDKKPGETISSIVSVSGMSGVMAGCAFRYNLGKGFALRFIPQFAWTPKLEISNQSTQFNASIGIGYSTAF